MEVTMRLRGERGGALMLFLVTVLGLMAVLALVVDTGIAFAARRDLQRIADAASRAGAMAIDVGWLRSNGTIRLDPDAAERHARRYLVAAGFEGEREIEADEDEVSVELKARRATLLMWSLGRDGVRIRVRAIALPRAGILRGF